MSFVTIPLLDAATLFCLDVTAAKETKELFIISIVFKIIPIIVSRFGLLANALFETVQSQSGFKNANILQVMFANVTSIGPPENAKSQYMQYKQFF